MRATVRLLQERATAGATGGATIGQNACADVRARAQCATADATGFATTESHAMPEGETACGSQLALSTVAAMSGAECGLIFNLWRAAMRLAQSEGVLQSGDGALHWNWCADAHALGHDCRSIPEGFELGAVRVEPLVRGNNSGRRLRVWRLPRSGHSGIEVLRLDWDEATAEPSPDGGLQVKMFERGLWEAALRERSARCKEV
ncbi:hypothetical protein ATE48_00275 [Candidatus Viadribacter manganicus]|uniref:Uncharacterized protein n=1 Tax=Candidatus Viadribacter manganicus TaxID=1759059 RepID=A0A1B1AD27_9PROT|nr:hypothetical protein ATE48_00275 [Candidatus Viadribacter manganicus]